MPPADTHEWVAFDDDREQRTWMLDVTFLASAWTCIFGQGCQGVLTEATPELAQGCCSYGAHLTDEADRQRVEEAATRLTPEQWQNHRRARRATTRVTRSGELMTRLVDDACIFLNRPDFARGPGCALHLLARDEGRSYVGVKPDVCWQLPLHREDHVTDSGHVVTHVGPWLRRHWGSGGDDFHWWCTQSPDAYVGTRRVADEMADELTAMVGPRVYARLLAYLKARAKPRPAARPVAVPRRRAPRS